MALEDLTKFHLKRVNPFQGLVIDADAWRDAHNYHREQMRLHVLAFHEPGIVEGLGLVANKPADLMVTVQPGIGVDPEGNVIVVPQKQQYRLQTQKAGSVFLVIQFREVPGEPYQPPDGGQPTRMLDAYRIQERDKLPTEPYIELGRIEFDPAGGVIRDAKAVSSPARNEIDLRFRKSVGPAIVERPIEEPSRPAVERVGREPHVLAVGHAVLGDAPTEMHVSGLRNLLGELSRDGGSVASLEHNVPLDKDLTCYSFLYLTGNSRFDLDSAQQAGLVAFLQSGGGILGEACSAPPEAGQSRGAKDFGFAFNQLAGQLKRKLEIVKRGHPVLSSMHVFSDVPQGAQNGMLLEGGRMMYSASDYGCAWHGGHDNQPLPRDVIRGAFEIGANIAAYARTRR